MLRNIFLKTLRDYRWGMLGWGLVLGVILFINVLEYLEFIKDSSQMVDFNKAYEAFEFLLGETVSVDTLGGFLTMETLVYGAVLLCAWAAVIGVGVVRGEEESGALDVLMATPHSRLEVIGQKIAAICVSIIGATAIMGAMLAAAVWYSGQTLPFNSILAELLNIAVFAIFWGAAGLLVGQLVAARKTASIFTIGLLLATYLLNTISETIPSWKYVGWALPFHYWSMSKPLVPGRGLDLGGMSVLVAGAAVLLLLSALIFVRRDLGRAISFWPARRQGVYTGKGSIALLGSVFGKTLRDNVVSTLTWGVGLIVYSVIVVATTREALAPMVELMNSIPLYTKIFGTLLSNESYLSVAVFYFLPMLMVIFALMQVWSWAGEEEDGRLEILVTEPVPRWQVMLVRYSVAVLSLAVILAMTIAGVLMSAAIVDLQVDTGRIVGATLAAAPVALVALAFGAALAAWLRRPMMAVGLTAGLVVVMFFVNMLAPLFDWPEAVRNLSVFYLYGTPVLEGIIWGNMAGLLIAALLLAMISVAGFQRRDIGT